ncbi:5563_t:CDS:1, partial [Funneliformis mosseae]
DMTDVDCNPKRAISIIYNPEGVMSIGCSPEEVTDEVCFLSDIKSGIIK